MKEERKRRNSRREAEPVKKTEEVAESKGFFSSRIALVLIAIVAVAFIVYSLVSISGIHSQIRERSEELEKIKEEITVQEIKNDSMSKTYNLTDSERSEYMEQLARDQLDFVKEGERVFVNVAGE
ncbi:MAG: septum formation initiator family protein [Ruminococcus sp.]|nr:septum formation initiator family protein [Ruminococcus sp.]MBQ9514556.1 septum formation initiator family protein [Ruminococcus sp.]